MIDKLQSVQNAAARLVFATRRRDHITPLLHRLHWLGVAKSITFRSVALTYLPLSYLHGSANRLPDTYRGSCSEFPTLVHISDYNPGHFPYKSFYHRWQIILCSRDLSLERLTGSDLFFNIFGAFQEVAEDGTVHTISHRRTFVRDSLLFCTVISKSFDFTSR